MRPVANFTLHAILAACLAALAASSAAAAKEPARRLIDNEGYAWLSLAPSGQQAGKGERLEVQSWQWGAVPSNSRQGGANELTMDDTAGKEKMRPGGGQASGDIVMKGSKIGENSAAAVGRVSGIATDPAEPAGARTGHSMLGASEKITVGGARTESAPAEKGSVWVRVSSPWAACRVGTHYPSIAFVGGGKSYELEDVQVADCGGRSASGPTEEISFVYNKVRVRGWDPKKKEE